MDFNMMPSAPSTVCRKDERCFAKCGQIIVMKVAPHVFQKFNTPYGIHSMRRPPGAPRKVVLNNLLGRIWEHGVRYSIVTALNTQCIDAMKDKP
jgi:hypothetical protein